MRLLDPQTTCCLCGDVGLDVHMEMIRWHRSDDVYGSGPRCKDRDACYIRVHDRGHEWPVDDGRRP